MNGIMKNKVLLLNGAVVLLIGATGVAIMRTYFFKEEIAACSQRYEKGTRMALDRSGVPMTGADLQARFSGADWGVLDGARVVPVKGGPSPLALELDMPAGQSAVPAPKAGASISQRPGVGFVWAPQSLKSATSACLAYTMHLPAGFLIGQGGRLPGLQVTDFGAEDADASFAVRPRWLREGPVHVFAEPAAGEAVMHPNMKPSLELPRGRWAAVEQETVLNTPGQADGVVRMWVDGVLAYERNGLTLRKSEKARFSGILAEFVAFGQSAAKPEDRRLQLSPFEIYWQ